MNIVYFIDHLRPDGAQFVLHQVVTGMHCRSHVQHVICLNDSFDPIMIEKINQAGASVSVIGKPALFSGVGLWSILRKLKQGKYDVAVSMLFASDLIGRPLARAAGIPRIVTSIQTHDQFYTSLQRWLLRQTAIFTDLVLLNSIHIQAFAVKEEGVDPAKIRIIYNGIDTSRYSLLDTRAQLLNEFNFPGGSFILGSVGRLTYQKGFDLLLAALAQLRLDNVYTIIAGSGEELEPLRAQAQRLKIDEKVIFAGYRRDIPRLLAGVDLYVHSSRFEGMPIAVLEAMASGRPIVATAVDGTRELIQDGVEGWLVPPDDVQALAQAIETALLERDEARRRGIAARHRAQARFNLDDILDAWEKALLGEKI